MDKEEKTTPQTITIKSDSTDEVTSSAPGQSQDSLNSVSPPPAVAVAIVEPEKLDSNKMTETATAAEASATESAQTITQEVHALEEKVESAVSEPTGELAGLVKPEPTINLSEKPDLADQPPNNMSASSSSTTSSALGASLNTESTESLSKSKEAGDALHEHRNNKKLAIVVTVVVAILLAGAAVYVYLSAQDNAAENKSSGNTQVIETDTKAVEPATSSELEATTQSVDEAINSLNDTSDFSDEALSDSALGL